MGKKIVCLGILVADVVGRPLRAVPEPGRLVLVDDIALHTGGCALNTATGLARLGLPVEVIGKVGSDPFGDFLLAEMAARGIGTRGVGRDSGVGTSATLVMVEPDGERRFVHYLGANARLTLDDVDRDLVRSAMILHVGGALVLPGLDGAPMAHLLAEARAAGVTTFLDTVWDDTGRWFSVLGPCLPHVDYFVPNLAEGQALTGQETPRDVARALLEHGMGTVVLKMGTHGCLVAAAEWEGMDDRVLLLPAFQVPAVDTTGAGDAFAAGFIAGVALGWEMARTTLLANALGALSVMGPGAIGRLCSLSETLAFMQATPMRSGGQLDDMEAEEK
jgi:sugar/nucleoside kinase (ribokinase family)